MEDEEANYNVTVFSGHRTIIAKNKKYLIIINPCDYQVTATYIIQILTLYNFLCIVRYFYRRKNTLQHRS
jgi:hypothetical protein